jgi:putative FmdB family regulatory protein
MPSYDYRCTCCSTHFEAWHAIADTAPPCPTCGGAAIKELLAAPAIHGHMARGREQAIQSLQPTDAAAPGRHGPGCPCCQH